MAEEKKTPLPLSIREYEKSKEWRKKSDTILSDKETVCEICGRRRWKWQPRVKKWKEYAGIKKAIWLEDKVDFVYKNR